MAISFKGAHANPANTLFTSVCTLADRVELA